MSGKSIARNGDLMSNGATMLSIVPTVFINAKTVVTVGAPTTDSHSMVTGSSSVFAMGRSICRLDDRDSGNHTATQGSPNVFSG